MTVPHPRLVITGGSGGVATLLRPALRTGHITVLLDRRPPDPPPGPAESAAVGDLADPGFLREQLRGAQAVVHLAGVPDPATGWPALRTANLDLTVALLEAARQTGVPKVVLASSVHASGQYDLDGPHPVDPALPPRPCCLYGAAKAGVEALAAVYSRGDGPAVLCLRLGWVLSRPHTPRALREWLSPGDLGRLILAALAAEVRYGVYYGASANARDLWSLTSAAADLGYVPLDDARMYAAGVGDGPQAPRDCSGSGPAPGPQS